MRRFVAHGEDRTLDQAARAGQPGSFAALADGLTHYRLSGPQDGPLVALLPGLTTPLGYWDGVVDRVTPRGFRTLSFSAYGRGLSDRVDGPYDPALFVRQLDQLLREVDARDVHLVASSMAALVALRYVRGPGAPVATLTLCGPAGLADQDTAVGKLPTPLAMLVGKYVLRRSLLKHIGRNVKTEAAAARLRPMVLDGFRYEHSAYALLSTLRHFRLSGQEELFDATTMALPPTMLLWGADDQVTPAADRARAAQLLRPVADHLIEACGHMVPFEQPDEFTEHLLTFITEPWHD